jgi:hypothetical protein
MTTFSINGSPGTGKWHMSSDQKTITLSVDATKNDIPSKIIELSKADLEFDMILDSREEFGTTVDYSVKVKGTRN